MRGPRHSPRSRQVGGRAHRAGLARARGRPCYHDRQLSEHGGAAGLRDAGALDSALARPVNRWSYGEDDRCFLAAAFAFGIARSHPFADGNKRTAWVLARLFLRLNGMVLNYAPEDAVQTMLALASGELGEDELADWFREHLMTS